MQKQISCDPTIFHPILCFMLLLQFVGSLYEIGILFFNGTIPLPFKFILLFQAQIYLCLILAQFSFLWSIKEFADLIMNMAALLIVNDFDKITGNYFLQKIDLEVVNSDDFMTFHGNKQILLDSGRSY